MKAPAVPISSRFIAVGSWLVGISLGLFLAAVTHGQADTAADPAAVAAANEDSGDFQISGFIDASYRETMFFEDDHDVALFEWDLRFEDRGLFDRERILAGPYLRVAGITASEDPAFENNWQALPGAGVQWYPLSYQESYLSPLRAFGEYNRQDYWGSENGWRPEDQFRAGFDYFLADGSNDPSRLMWFDFWSGLFWQSSNDFDDDYDGVIMANVLRIGGRVPDQGLLSVITPYVLVDSKYNINDRGGPEWWNNKLDLGGGVRLAPSLEKLPGWLQFLKYGNLYAEWAHTAAYYRDSAPDDVPEHELRAGFRIGIGDFIKSR